MTSISPASLSAPYRAIFGASPLPMWVHDASTGQFLIVNDATAAVYGYSRAQLLEMKVDAIAATGESIESMMRATVSNQFIDGGRHRTAGGRIIDVEINVQRLLLDGREVLVVLASDVTARRERDERLHEGERLISEVLERISDAFVALDNEWRYTYVNEAAARIFGRSRKELLGKHIWTEFPEGVGQPFHLAYEEALTTQEFRRIEAYYPPWDRWFENRIYPSPRGLTIYFHDVTERRETEAELRQLALKDPVTGLANRVLFCDRLRISIAHAHRHNTDVALLLLDIDGFRSLNERYGLAFSDALLRQIGDRLQCSVRDCDTVGRIGSDEFGIVLQDVRSSHEALKIAEKIRAVFADEFEAPQVPILLTASIGVAVYPQHGHDCDLLLQAAEQAMHGARRAGRGQLILFGE